MCLSCNQVFPTKEELVAHQEELQHTGEGVSNCDNESPDAGGTEPNEV